MSTFLDDLKRLVELQSPSEDLNACRQIMTLAKEIADVRLNTTAEIVEENGRPVFWWGSQSPEIILLAHLDTVWPIDSYLPLWSVDNDKIAGPGIFDMKAGFLQALYALIGIEGAQNQVALIATSDEELGSQTSKDLILRISHGAKAVLVLEASLNGNVKIGRKGTAMYQVTIHGRAAHAGLEPEKGINASTEIAAVVTALSLLENNEHGTTVVPTTIHSGTTTNTVPALATLDIDSRSFTMAEMERVEESLRAMTPIHPEARIEIVGGINRPPLELSATSALFERVKAIAQRENLAVIGGVSVGGASDGNFAAAAGAPTLDGLGAIGDGAHASHEHILASSIPGQISLLTSLIKDLM